MTLPAIGDAGKGVRNTDAVNEEGDFAVAAGLLQPDIHGVGVAGLELLVR